MFRELHFTLTFLRDFITGNDLVSLYTQLAAAYTKVSQEGTAGSSPTPDSEIAKQIEQLQSSILGIHSTVNFTIWTAPKVHTLKQLQATPIIGPKAIEKLNEILGGSFGSASTIASGITSLQTQTSELLTRVNQGIAVFGLEDFKVEIPEGKQLLEIGFEDEAAMKNFWEVTDRSKEWSYIVRSFTRLTSQNYDSVVIDSQVSGSDLGTTLELAKNTAEAIIMGTKAAIALKCVKDKFFQKKKKLDDVGIPNQATFKLVIKGLEEERDGEYKKKMEEFSVEITKPFIAKGTNDGHELENMVGIALDKMTEMFVQGVKVVDPKEITAVATPEIVPVLGPEYAQNKILSDEVKALLTEEVQKQLEARHERMVEELEIKEEELQRVEEKQKVAVPLVKKNKKQQKVKSENPKEPSKE